MEWDLKPVERLMLDERRELDTARRVEAEGWK